LVAEEGVDTEGKVKDEGEDWAEKEASDQELVVPVREDSDNYSN
jgi:hypothetical protein